MNIAIVTEWRNAAVADGWEVRPLYDNEPIESAAKLTREEFVVHTISRPAVRHWRERADISGWGPDGLSIAIPLPYDMDRIRQALRRCNPCGAQDVDTHQYSFAGRCCAECLPAMKRKHEYPGWTR